MRSRVIVGALVFQEDLRRLFERIAVLGLRRSLRPSSPDVLDAITRACTELAANHIGALIVLPGREPLTRHLDGGVFLRGRVSTPLLRSLFDAHSPGHDGAIVIEGNEVSRFSVHLPLSTNLDALRDVGTRHTAALGLAERTDALCIVVSEERGRISLAWNGELRAVANDAELRDALQRFQSALKPAQQTGIEVLQQRLVAGRREVAAALALSTLLWLLLVPGSTIARDELEIPIEVENLPEGYVLDHIEPTHVRVTVEGLRRDLFLAGSNRIFVRLDGLLAQLGRRTFAVGPEAVVAPEDLRVLGLTPDTVRLELHRADLEPVDAVR